MKSYYYGFRYLFNIDLVSGISYDKTVPAILQNFWGNSLEYCLSLDWRCSPFKAIKWHYIILGGQKHIFSLGSERRAKKRERRNLKFKFVHCPGWCGSVDWAPSCEPKGRWCDSQSGHSPGLRARPPDGDVREAVDVSLAQWCFSPCLSPSLALPIKVNKILLKICPIF